MNSYTPLLYRAFMLRFSRWLKGNGAVGKGFVIQHKKHSRFSHK